MLALIKDAKPNSIIWDREDKACVRGLHLKTADSGKQTWMLFYRTKWGQQRRPKIGDYPAIGLHDARKRAKELLDLVAKGEDPKGLWDEKREEFTLNDLFAECFKKHWNTTRFIKSGHAGEVSKLYENHLKNRFGSMRLSELTPGQIKSWHDSMVRTPIAGNRALEVLSKMFNLAISWEILPLGLNPVKPVKHHPERKRIRYAGEEELKKIGQILDEEMKEHRAEVTFLYLLMYTGARPRAIERGLRSQIKEAVALDRRYGLMTYDGKTTEATGLEETIVFPPQAMDLLDQLPAPKDGTLTGVKMPAMLWKRVREKAGCSDLWARDFRRTFASMGLSYGLDPVVVGELQNHKSAQTRMLYQKLLPSVRASACSSIADKLDFIMKEEKTL